MVIAVGANNEVDLLIRGILAISLGQTKERIFGGSRDHIAGEDGGTGGRHDVRINGLEAVLGDRSWGRRGRRSHDVVFYR